AAAIVGRGAELGVAVDADHHLYRDLVALAAARNDDDVAEKVRAAAVVAVGRRRRRGASFDFADVPGGDQRPFGRLAREVGADLDVQSGRLAASEQRHQPKGRTSREERSHDQNLTSGPETCPGDMSPLGAFFSVKSAAVIATPPTT